MESYKIQKIESKYVSDDCVQLMTSYKKNLSIFYLDVFGCRKCVFVDTKIYDSLFKTVYTSYKNTYLEDNRRFLFPYSNIATHNSISGLSKIKRANVILEFDKIYIFEIDNNEFYARVFKNEFDAIIFMCSDWYTTKTITLEELKMKKIHKVKNPYISKLLNMKIKIQDLKNAKEVNYAYALEQMKNEEINNLIKKYDLIEEKNEENLENDSVKLLKLVNSLADK